MGGLDSEAKAVWMVSAVDQWFSENCKYKMKESRQFTDKTTHRHSF